MTPLSPPAPHQTSLPWRTLAAIAAILLTFLIYTPLLHGNFLWDDLPLLLHNPLLQNLQGLHDIWLSTRAPDYLPLFLSSWWLDWHLWGASPLPYHLINLLQHIASCLLLWSILKKLRLPGPFLASLLFAIHPVNVMSVGWISERKNTLSLLLYLASIRTYLAAFPDTLLPQPHARNHPRILYALSIFFFLLALLSKSSIIMLPLILLLLTWQQRGQITRRTLLRITPFLFASAISALVTIWFQHHRAMAGLSIPHLGFPARLARAGWIPFFYLSKALCPIQLSPIYPPWRDHGLISYLPAFTLLLTLFILWRTRNRIGRAPLAALLYFLLSLAPVAGFIDMAFMQYSPVSDHFQYVALIGILTFLAASLTHLKHRHPRTGNLITLLLVSFFSFTAYTQAHIYHDEHSFWQAAVSRNPASPQAQYNLGTVLQSEGQNDQAIACYRRATTLDPHCADAHSNLGLLLTRAGSFPEGTAELRQALADKPDATAYRNLSLALITTPQWQEAISLLEHAVHLEPNDSELHSLLGAAYSSHSLYPQAISEARQSANLSPKNPTRLNDLAWLLATQPTPLPSDRPQAVQYAQQACLLTHYQDPAILDTLAVAYHANGQTPEALTTESQALTLAQSNPSQHPLIQELTTHLNQFRSPPSH